MGAGDLFEALKDQHDHVPFANLEVVGVLSSCVDSPRRIIADIKRVAAAVDSGTGWIAGHSSSDGLTPRLSAIRYNRAGRRAVEGAEWMPNVVRTGRINLVPVGVSKGLLHDLTVLSPRRRGTR